MGLFDNIKKVIRENVPEKAVNAIENAMGFDIDGVEQGDTAARRGEEIKNTATTVETISFEPIEVPNSYEAKNILFCYDDDGTDYEVQQTFMMHHNFKEFDSGAGELDCSYIFNVSEEVKYSADKPVLGIGFSQHDYELVTGYVTSGKVPENAIITKLENCVADYRTECVRGDLYIRAYHFFKEGYTTIYSQMYVEMPNYLKNSYQAKEAFEALDQIVSTYKEERLN